MAKTGRVKWDHYFKDRTVSTYVKANSKSTLGKNITGDGVKLDHGTPITVFGGDTYSTRLQISWQGRRSDFPLDCIDKPGKTNVRMQIEATKLIAKGDDKVVPNILGVPDVKCKCFNTPEQIAASVIDGLEREPSVPDYVTEQVLDYFMDNLSGNYNFTWSESVVDGIKKQLGTYVGEMLVGYIGLAGAPVGHMSRNVLPRDMDCFLVPDDPQFAGVDSLFLAKDGSQVPISSKYGRGALASVWANIIPVAMKYKSSLSDCILKDLVTAAEAVGGDPSRKGKEIVYQYGIRQILGVDTDKPYEVFKAFKSGNLKEHAPVLLKALQYVKAGGDGTESSAKVLITNGKQGGKSLTAILSRGIADRLNNDAKSLAEAKRLIAGKDFYQANLDDSKFLKGQVYFNMSRAADMKLSFSGSKASTSNIDASQGTVNYLLA